MKKFTKGNWTVDIDTPEETDHSAQLVRAGQTVVCLVSPADDVCEVSTANANLIAAAPELLRELQDTQLLLSEVLRGMTMEELTEEQYRDNQIAINKALGHE